MNDQPMVITLRDVYDVVTALRQDLQSMKREVDMAAISAATDHDRMEDHEARIRFLERWAWSIPAAVVTGVLSVITTIMIAIL